jgi:hypothetical protein
MARAVRSTPFAAMAVIVASVVFMACGDEPSEAEFVDACLQEGQGIASQMLDAELGVTREAFCECGAGVARASLSADGYRAMVLEMQGRGEEAASITSAMSEAEQMATLEGTLELLEQCAAAR